MTTHTLRLGGLSWRLHGRTCAAVAGLAVATVLAGLLSLRGGEYPLSLREVAMALSGQGSAELRMVVLDWRLPRVLLAMLVGMALGASGAIFQSLTRNALGSPDIIGFNTGATTGALVVALWAGHGGYAERAAGALAGGVLTAVLVVALASRRGVQGFRLILVGIGVGAMLLAINNYLILQADLRQAMQAAVWLVGSLDTVGWKQVVHVGLPMAVLLPAAMALARPMRMMEMGDDVARSLGIAVEPARIGLLLAGVGLVAVTTPAVGPIAFVALAAPQLARRMTGGAGVSIVPSAAMGAGLLVASDWAAQRLFAPAQVPVGVMTVSVGGLYLIWLLARQQHQARSAGG